MPATYTPSLSLTLPAVGDTNWGTTVNNGITSLVDDSVAGTATITMVASDYTLSTTQGVANEARKMFITATGTPGAARNIIVPAVSKLYFVYNNTTGGFAQTVKTAAGTGVSVPNGARMVLYCNGTDVVGALSALATALPVSSGGTGLISTPSNGQIDIGNGSGFTRTTLTAGSNITITNGAGSISIAATVGAQDYIVMSYGIV